MTTVRHRTNGVFSRFSRSVSASIVTMAALMMPVILGMAGLGLDASNWLMTQRMLQNSVDAAVISAAWEIAHGESSNAQTSAAREAANNGYNSAKNGTLTLVISTDNAGETVVTATLKQKADVYLSRIMHGGDIYVAATAAATLLSPTGDFCILALNNAASGALTFLGNPTINSAGCGLAMNSNSATALQVGGSSFVQVNDISIVGGSNIACSTGGALQCNSMKTNSGLTADPYANLAVPNYTPCTAAQIAAHTILGQQPNGNTYYPGTYCGGLSISGNGAKTFSPGVYTLDSGNFDIAGNGSLTGTNVAFVLTSSSGSANIGKMALHGGADINFTAPAAGSSMQGVVFYQDRNAPSDSGGTCSNIFNGTGALNIMGSTYFPSQCVHILGNRSTASSACTRLVADTIVFQGNFNLGSSCSGIDVQNIGQYTVKLTM